MGDPTKCSLELGDGFEKAKELTEAAAKDLEKNPDAIDKILNLDEKRIAAMQQVRYFNALNNQKKLNDIKSQMLYKIDANSGPYELKRNVKRMVNAFDDQRHTVAHQALGDLEKNIDQVSPDAWDYFTDRKNELNLYTEIEAQRKFAAEGKPGKSITGDDKAFQIAKRVVDKGDELLKLEQAAGSLKGYREGWVTKNRWDSLNIASNFNSARGFYDFVKDNYKINGEIADEATWTAIYDRVKSGNHTKIDAEIDPLHDVLGAQFNNFDAGSMAEVLGMARKIEAVSAEAYMKTADKLFSGDSLATRILQDVHESAKAFVTLNKFGTDPANQYTKALNEVIATTTSNRRMHRLIDLRIEKAFGFLPYVQAVGGKHKLDIPFFQKIIPKGLMGEDTMVNNLLGAQVSSFARAWEALDKLSQSIFVSLTDPVFTIKRVIEVLPKDEFMGFRIGEELSKTMREMASSIPVNFGRFSKLLGDRFNNDALKKLGNAMPMETVLEKELRSLGIGIEFAADKMRNDFRFHDEVALVNNANTGVANVIGTGTKWINGSFKYVNLIHGLTEIRQQLSAFSAMSRWHDNKGLSLDALHPLYQEILNDVGITSKEWDFIRGVESTGDIRGRQILSIDDLNALPLSAWKGLTDSENPSKAVLEKIKYSTVAKYSGLLGYEVKKSTPLNSLTTRLTINRGTARGTPEGEALRFGGQFKSFPIEVWTEIMEPMYRRGNTATSIQVSAALGAGYMIGQLLKGVANNRKPIDAGYFTKPSTIAGTIFGGILSMPIMDTMMYNIFSKFEDNPRDLNIGDVAAGPVPAEFFKIVFGPKGAADLIGRAGKGDLTWDDVGKATAKVLYRNTPLINSPGLSVMTDALYNEYMNDVSPGWAAQNRKYLEGRGLEQIVPL